MLFHSPTKILEVKHPAKVLEAFSAAEEALAEGFFVAGYISYEAGFALEPSLADLSAKVHNGEPLLWLGCYRRPEICGEVAPSFAKPRTAPMNLRFLLSADEYASKVEEIRRLIAAGETR